MSKFIDLTGSKFGRLTVINRELSKNHRTMWLCKCDCGNFCIIDGSNLKSGNTKSCGCYHSERLYQGNLKTNQYDLTKKYGIGYTSKGEEFYFDLEDYDKIKDYCWYKTHFGYIATRVKRSKTHIFMHRLLLNYTSELDIDHINGNTIDNRKSNLRICNHCDNMKNQTKRKTNTSGIVGVYWDRKRNKWVATLKFNGKSVLHKRFDKKEEAIQARKEAEAKYFGEFARKN